MKWIVRVLALLLALFTMAAPAAAGQGERPERLVKGTVTGVANFAFNEDCGGLQTQADAAGTIRHLGRVEMRSEHCTPAGSEISGRMVLTAANGDQLFADYAGTCLADLPWVVGETVFDCQTPFDVVGGTGRFDDATGDGHLGARVLFLDGQPDWPGTWTITAEVRY